MTQTPTQTPTPTPPYEIRSAAIPANVKRPMLQTKTRWEYLNTHLDLWKQVIRFKFASYLLAMIGAWALLFSTADFIAPFALGLATYLYQRQGVDANVRLASERRVIYAA